MHKRQETLIGKEEASKNPPRKDEKYFNKQIDEYQKIYTTLCFFTAAEDKLGVFML